MIGLLRLVAVLNAAIWFGAAIFFTFGAGPVFFTPEFKQIIPPPYNGVAAEFVIGRFFILQHICGIVAVGPLLAEWLYTGRPLERFLFGLLLGIFCVGLVGGFWLQPRLKHWHVIRYRGATSEERAAAGRAFGIGHGISQVANLMIMAGIGFYLLRVTNPKGSKKIGLVPGARL